MLDTPGPPPPSVVRWPSRKRRGKKLHKDGIKEPKSFLGRHKKTRNALALTIFASAVAASSAFIRQAVHLPMIPQNVRTWLGFRDPHSNKWMNSAVNRATDKEVARVYEVVKKAEEDKEAVKMVEKEKKDVKMVEKEKKDVKMVGDSKDDEDMDAAKRGDREVNTTSHLVKRALFDDANRLDLVPESVHELDPSLSPPSDRLTPTRLGESVQRLHQNKERDLVLVGSPPSTQTGNEKSEEDIAPTFSKRGKVPKRFKSSDVAKATGIAALATWFAATFVNRAPVQQEQPYRKRSANNVDLSSHTEQETETKSNLDSHEAKRSTDDDFDDVFLHKRAKTGTMSAGKASASVGGAMLLAWLIQHAMHPVADPHVDRPMAKRRDSIHYDDESAAILRRRDGSSDLLYPPSGAARPFPPHTLTTAPSDDVKQQLYTDSSKIVDYALHRNEERLWKQLEELREDTGRLNSQSEDLMIFSGKQQQQQQQISSLDVQPPTSLTDEDNNDDTGGGFANSSSGTLRPSRFSLWHLVLAVFVTFLVCATPLDACTNEETVHRLVKRAPGTGLIVQQEAGSARPSPLSLISAVANARHGQRVTVEGLYHQPDSHFYRQQEATMNRKFLEYQAEHSAQRYNAEAHGINVLQHDEPESDEPRRQRQWRRIDKKRLAAERKADKKFAKMLGIGLGSAFALSGAAMGARKIYERCRGVRILPRGAGVQMPEIRRAGGQVPPAFKRQEPLSAPEELVRRGLKLKKRGLAFQDPVEFVPASPLKNTFSYGQGVIAIPSYHEALQERLSSFVKVEVPFTMGNALVPSYVSLTRDHDNTEGTPSHRPTRSSNQGVADHHFVTQVYMQDTPLEWHHVTLKRAMRFTGISSLLGSLTYAVKHAWNRSSSKADPLRHEQARGIGMKSQPLLLMEQNSHPGESDDEFFSPVKRGESNEEMLPRRLVKRAPTVPEIYHQGIAATPISNIPMVSYGSTALQHRFPRQEIYHFTKADEAAVREQFNIPHNVDDNRIEKSAKMIAQSESTKKERKGGKAGRARRLTPDRLERGRVAAVAPFSTSTSELDDATHFVTQIPKDHPLSSAYLPPNSSARSFAPSSSDNDQDGFRVITSFPREHSSRNKISGGAIAGLAAGASGLLGLGAAATYRAVMAGKARESAAMTDESSDGSLTERKGKKSIESGFPRKETMSYLGGSDQSQRKARGMKLKQVNNNPGEPQHTITVKGPSLVKRSIIPAGQVKDQDASVLATAAMKALGLAADGGSAPLDRIRVEGLHEKPDMRVVRERQRQALKQGKDFQTSLQKQSSAAEFWNVDVSVDAASRKKLHKKKTRHQQARKLLSAPDESSEASQTPDTPSGAKQYSPRSKQHDNWSTGKTLAIGGGVVGGGLLMLPCILACKIKLDADVRAERSRERAERNMATSSVADLMRTLPNHHREGTSTYVHGGSSSQKVDSREPNLAKNEKATGRTAPRGQESMHLVRRGMSLDTSGRESDHDHNGTSALSGRSDLFLDNQEMSSLDGCAHPQCGLGFRLADRSLLRATLPDNDSIKPIGGGTGTVTFPPLPSHHEQGNPQERALSAHDRDDEMIMAKRHPRPSGDGRATSDLACNLPTSSEPSIKSAPTSSLFSEIVNSNAHNKIISRRMPILSEHDSFQEDTIEGERRDIHSGANLSGVSARSSHSSDVQLVTSIGTGNSRTQVTPLLVPLFSLLVSLTLGSLWLTMFLLRQLSKIDGCHEHSPGLRKASLFEKGGGDYLSPTMRHRRSAILLPLTTSLMSITSFSLYAVSWQPDTAHEAEYVERTRPSSATLFKRMKPPRAGGKVETVIVAGFSTLSATAGFIGLTAIMGGKGGKSEIAE
ncbi:hypothetical protein CBS101457_002218 [Exobasidium rhododendri]|nr:hypothetical protein CBS101457_002218 [Exobasidium rhododendri]